MIGIMRYKKQVERFAELSRKLDAGLQQCSDKEELPLSFFSQSYAILREMMGLLQSIEESQASKMPHGYSWKMSISDRFLFLKGLFANDKEVMETVMKDLETFSSLTEAVAYLDARFEWDWEDEVPSIFKLLLESIYE